MALQKRTLGDDKTKSKQRPLPPQTAAAQLFEKEVAGVAAIQRARLRPGSLAPRHIPRLQQALGNRAVDRLLAASGRTAAVNVRPNSTGKQLVQLVKQENVVYDIKKKNERQFLREILEGLDYDRWQFPMQEGGDGCLGKNCISKGAVYQVPNAKKEILYHVNFMISAGTMTKSTANKRGRLVLSLSLLHLTARSIDTQGTIVENGPSIVTAGKSIHCGPNNDWDWNDAHVDELAGALGCTKSDIQVSANNAGLGQRYMSGLVPKLKQAIADTVQGHLPNIDVEWGNLDNTWS